MGTTAATDPAPGRAAPARGRLLKLLWVALLVVSSFLLGRYLNPSGTSRSPFSGAAGFPAAPPLSFPPYGGRGR